MPSLKQTLSYLILGQTGGHNRVQIIDLLKERAYNTNQLAEQLDLNYRTIKHHIDVLIEHGIITTFESDTGDSTYGNVFFLSPEMEDNLDYYDEVVRKLAVIKESPTFFENIVEQINDGIIIIDNGGINLYWNNAAERLFGYDGDEIIGTPIRIFKNRDTFEKNIRKVVNGRGNEERKIMNYQTKGLCKSGDAVDMNVTITDFKNDDKKIIGFCILVNEVIC